MNQVLHSLGLVSWVESANNSETDFPLQNLPFGRFKLPNDSDWRIGVAIGDQVLDLNGVGVVASHDISRLLRLAPEPRRAVRQVLSAGLRKGSQQAQA